MPSTDSPAETSPEQRSELVHYESDRAIATITLDSPANRNALSARLVSELGAHLATAAGDDGIRAVVLTHTGRTFCAGADLAEASAEGGPQAGTARMLDLLRQVVELPKPVIAVLDGNVRAGGVGLVGACDIALAGPGSSFAFTEVRLGLAPAIITLATLSRLTERASARYYLTGEVFDATEGARIGLVTEAPADLATARTALEDALRLCSPQGLAETKPLTTATLRAAFAERGDDLQALSARLFASEEAREGMQSFLEKRPARWASS